ncbi:MAG: aminoacyl-tRNA hydrolase, partial [Candidatus Polarisedimenticolia bacterium]
MKILLGLGNPGDEYAATRHNAGFLVAEEFLRRHGAGRVARRGRSLVAVAGLGGMDVMVARPLTFMNRSGEAAAALLREADCGPADLLVACDDLYLDLGTIRLRPGGGHGGHNGLRSILEALGSVEIPRLRLGVGPPGEGVPHAAFVLEPFRRSEREAVGAMVTRAADAA